MRWTRKKFESHLAGGFPYSDRLSDKDQKIFDEYREWSDAELWTVVQPLTEPEPEAEEEFQVGEEGRLRAVSSLRRERNPALRAKALQIHGLDCQVCGFNFEETYGEWGRGFIEVHHLELLSSSEPEGREVDPVEDLRVLCSNCHRMIHRRRKRVLTLTELRNLKLTN